MGELQKTLEVLGKVLSILRGLKQRTGTRTCNPLDSLVDRGVQPEGRPTGRATGCNLETDPGIRAGRIDREGEASRKASRPPRHPSNPHGPKREENGR